MDTETRLYTLEQDIKKIFDRLGKVEDKSAGAWNTIREVNARMDKLETKVDGLERDVKELKVCQKDVNRSMKILTKVVIVLCGIVAAYVVYSVKSGSELPGKIVEGIVPALLK